jgi:hypothetical protein
MFALPTQPSSIVLEIANVHAMFLKQQDDDDSDWEISENESEHPGEYTLSSNIEEDNLDHRQEVLHQVQACHQKTV